MLAEWGGLVSICGRNKHVNTAMTVKKLGWKIKNDSKFAEETSVIGYQQFTCSNRIQNTTVDSNAVPLHTVTLRKVLLRRPEQQHLLNEKIQTSQKNVGRVVGLTIEVLRSQIQWEISSAILRQNQESRISAHSLEIYALSYLLKKVYKAVLQSSSW